MFVDNVKSKRGGFVDNERGVFNHNVKSKKNLENQICAKKSIYASFLIFISKRKTEGPRAFLFYLI